MTTDPKDVGMGAPKRKLIEVALPLEAINAGAATEKAVPRRGHPATLHLWWARRPVAAARAILFAQLVDDPSNDPDRFPTDQDQRRERERLHDLISRLADWDSTSDQGLLDEARQEILRSTDGNPPSILDPFAGGGTIPLEAQRLGLAARASDINPVAVLINKALVEYPPTFAGTPPVSPGIAEARMDWPGAAGLAADVRAYGEWMRYEAERRIGFRYPTAALPNGEEATVIAWIWARTVICPNPACGIEMPLARSWWLCKKNGKEVWVKPTVVPSGTHPSGKTVDFQLGYGKSGAPSVEHNGTVGRTGATCIACGSAVALGYIRTTSRGGGLGAKMMAVIAEGNRQRTYLPPSQHQREAAAVNRPDDAPEESLPVEALGFRVQNYGLTRWADLFSSRQLLALATFSDLVIEARERVVADALAAEMLAGERLEDGGHGAEAYADAVAVYLSYLGSKLADWHSSLCSWMAGVEKAGHTFGRQSLSMVWDFVELNPFSNSVGNVSAQFDWIVRAVELLPAQEAPGSVVRQADAQRTPLDAGLISTDPPYYDNIGYSDLSDYFYVWQRRSLGKVLPKLFSTVLVPKADELVANPFRHHGKDGARRFFEDGFRRVFERARETAVPGFPITVYYAFKQSDESADGTGSAGWETLLDGMILSGWEITATWPLRSERGGRLRDIGSNALASSIVLALRPRPDDAPTTNRRGLIQALQDELPDALRTLQQGAIAPVDLPQAAIGPGMAVFSRFSRVIEDDGSRMTVRAALLRINEILDQVLNEQEGDFDSATRFAIAWYRQHGYATGKFGVADDLARARNTAVETLVRDGILTSMAGKVTLLSPAKLPEDYDAVADDRVGTWEVLHHLIAILDRDGLSGAGAFLASAQERPDGAIDTELVKELAFLLFSIAEKNGWTQDALAFNTVATAWPDVVHAARATETRAGDQAAFDFGTD